jgi:hypothetical protein
VERVLKGASNGASKEVSNAESVVMVGEKWKIEPTGTDIDHHGHMRPMNPYSNRKMTVNSFGLANNILAL